MESRLLQEESGGHAAASTRTPSTEPAQTILYGSAAMSKPLVSQSVYRNINAFTDLTSYRMPLAALVSILHRISGAIMFVLLPFIIWMFDTSVSSEISFERFKSAFNIGVGVVPGWFIKLIALLFHAWVGIRDVFMDYVKPVAVRLALQIFSIAWLVSCAGWAIQVLWRL